MVTTNRLQAVRRSTGSSADATKGYENALEAFKTICKEGISSLYAGYESAVIGTAYANAVYYYLYQLLTEIARRVTQHQTLHLLDNIVVAALSGAATAVASNPIWTINTRMSLNAKSGASKSALATGIEMVQQEGVSSLFAGVFPALVLVSNPVINYVLFERILLALKGKRLTGLHIFLIGCVTKLIAALVTHPYLVIKTRMQSNKNDASVGMSDALANIIRTEGLPGLFAGLSMKLVHSVLTSALLFLIKDRTTSFSINTLVLLGLIKLQAKHAHH